MLPNAANTTFELFVIVQLYDYLDFFGVLKISDQFQPKEKIRFCALKKH